MLLSFVWMMSCNPAQLIRAPKIKPMPKVDTSAQEARQHLYTASYFHVKQDQANMELHLQQAWLRTEDPGICVFFGGSVARNAAKGRSKTALGGLFKRHNAIQYKIIDNRFGDDLTL